MRAYLATTPNQISRLLDNGREIFEEYLTPGQFDFPIESSEEEQENLVAQLASDDSDDLNGGKGRYVLAVELLDDQLGDDKLEIRFDQVEALFVGEDLSWFAPEEIEFEISNWGKK